MKILVNGAAGFNGFPAVKALLARGDEVVGVDNLNYYYDINLKYFCLDVLYKEAGFKFIEIDLSDWESARFS